MDKDCVQEEIILQLESEDEADPRVKRRLILEIDSENEVDSNRKFYVCYICRDESMDLEELEQHFNEIHSDMNIKYDKIDELIEEYHECEICSVEFASMKLLNEHYRGHNDRYFCEICNEGFKMILDKILHQIEHSDDGQYKCELCDYKHQGRFEIISHVQGHLKKEIFKCNLCFEKFSDRMLFDLHMKQHSGKFFGCQYCGSKFSTKTNLNLHKKNAHANEAKGIDDEYTCDYCGQSFIHKYKLRNHLNTVHESKKLGLNIKDTSSDLNFQVTNEFHTCEICKKDFASLKLLNEHYEEHGNQYICEVCSQGFKTALEKVLHMVKHNKDGHFYCIKCNFKTTLKKNIVRHLNQHLNTLDIYKCDQCDKRFRIKRLYEAHVKIHGEKLACIYCGKKFASKTHLNTHQANVHRFEKQGVDAVKSYHECHICGKNFQYKYKVRNHINMVHNKSELTQKDCNEVFTDFVCYICRDNTMNGKELILHFFQKHPGTAAVFKRQHEMLTEIHGCEICKVEFASLKLLNQHLGDHEAQHFCEICNEGFKLIFEKIVHMLGHSSDDNYRCLFCDYKNSNKIEIKNHVNKHLETSLIYKCQQCEKRFGIASLLKDHVKVVHSQEKPFSCEICGKTFALKRHLNVHQLNVHRNEIKGSTNAHICHICGKNFTYNYKLKNHIETVHEKNQLICEICGKVIYHKRTMLEHMKNHKGEKNFKCEFCDMKFVSSTAMKGHERIHTGEKPYQCNLCDESFSSSGKRNFHQLRHSNPTPFQCNYCSKKFASKSGFRLHVSQCEWEHAHKNAATIKE